MKFPRGTLVVANLDPVTGHEQRGRRPSIVVSNPDASEHQRFPTLCLVPVTSTPGTGALYPAIGAGARSGLSRTSYAMVDQLRSVDKRRVQAVVGQLALEELEAVDLGIRLFLGV
ncbi:MAG: type II toxin-antitoxin system PemK/MazF family toxin [Armatimonadetes bacterium]|nr:type II toxin-antitoxin system PemK/MazF family toxin [Armatimonadota bacterium]